MVVIFGFSKSTSRILDGLINSNEDNKVEVTNDDDDAAADDDINNDVGHQRDVNKANTDNDNPTYNGYYDCHSGTGNNQFYICN